MRNPLLRNHYDAVLEEGMAAVRHREVRDSTKLATASSNAVVAVSQLVRDQRRTASATEETGDGVTEETWDGVQAMQSSPCGETEATPPYERQRRRNIEQNEVVLRNLGLM